MTKVIYYLPFDGKWMNTWSIDNSITWTLSEWSMHLTDADYLHHSHACSIIGQLRLKKSSRTFPVVWKFSFLKKNVIKFLQRKAAKTHAHGLHHNEIVKSHEYKVYYTPPFPCFHIKNATFLSKVFHQHNVVWLFSIRLH